MEESLESLMNEIRELLKLLESSLPRRVDAMAVSRSAKLPFKALACRAALIWRMTELGRVAFESFENDRLAAAILLTRAAVETSAALWYLCGKLDAAVQSGVVGDIDDYLMKLLMGSRVNLDIMPQAINVLKFVDHVDKDIEGFRDSYDILSEYAHPNWAGTMFLYSKPDAANLSYDFGANIRTNDNTKHVGVNSFSGALVIFEHTYKRIADIMPAFVALCESQLKAGDSDEDGETAPESTG